MAEQAGDGLPTSINEYGISFWTQFRYCAPFHQDSTQLEHRSSNVGPK